ncbi:MAG: hypothetical protein ACREQL_08720, partial [Candidatus Binatia bacterium]
MTQPELRGTPALGSGPWARWRPLAHFGAHLGIFAMLSSPWLVRASHAFPVVGPAYPAAPDRLDARLIAWILAWSAHALGSAPTRLYDANIFHPAPWQLTGSEHLLSTQLLFAPVFWLTGNAVLATNACVFVSYPLASFAMERLLLALGIAAAPAFVAGLAFALGPLRVPANVQILQYPNFWLPVVVTSLLRVCDRPSRSRVLSYTILLTLGLLSSYYAAVMVLVAVVVTTGLLLPRTQNRRRIVAIVTASSAVAAAPLVLVSLPYLSRFDAALEIERWSMIRDFAPTLVLRSLRPWFGSVPLALAAAGLATLWSRDRDLRWIARAGLAYILAAGALIQVLSLHTPGLAFAPVAVVRLFMTFRFPWRILVLAGFGTALLVAAVLAELTRRVGRTAPLIAGALLVVGYGRHLASARVDEVAAFGVRRPLYERLGEIRATAPGPLLEVPAPQRGRDADAMIASTLHWLPLVSGHTGYLAAHAALVDRLVAALPAPDALADLVDVTRVRWILLHPPEDWPQPAVRDAFLKLPSLQPRLEQDGFVLLEVEHPLRHPEWSRSIADGPRRDQSLLGTPLAPLPPAGAIAIVRSQRPLPDRIAPGRRLRWALLIANTGTAAWPVVVAPSLTPLYTV